MAMSCSNKISEYTKDCDPWGKTVAYIFPKDNFMKDKERLLHGTWDVELKTKKKFKIKKFKVEIFRTEQEWVTDKRITVRHIFNGPKLMYKIFLWLYRRFIIIEYYGIGNKEINILPNIHDDLFKK